MADLAFVRREGPIRHGGFVLPVLSRRPKLTAADRL
jgi:hypothetical protein